MNLQNIKLMGKTSSWLAKLPLRLMTASGNIDAREDRSSWKEKKMIFSRERTGSVKKSS